MAKLVLVDIASLQAESSAIQSLNLNWADIEAAIENTLSRDGTAPNQMEATLDMNSNRIINVAAPVNSTDVARLTDVANALSVTATLVPSLTGNSGKIMSNDGTTLVWRTPAQISGLGDLTAANNLSELTATASTARINLGLGTAAIVNTGTSGDAFGKLNANKTDSGNNSFTGTAAFTGAVTLGGTVDHRITATPTALTDESIGFRSLPANVQDATYTFVLTDSGKLLSHTSASAHTWTIPPNSSVAYPVGTVIGLINSGAGAVTIARGSGVALRKAGSSTDANATLSQHGVASLIKADTNSWYISGSGVT